jgi:hypothetical protein
MTRKLIGLPFRLGVGGARFAVRGLADASEWGIELISALTGLRSRPPEAGPPRTDHEPAPRPPAPQRRAMSRPRPPAESRRPTEPRPAPPRPSPEPPAIVHEVADPGAEDGAGAQVTVAEPWQGYDRLGARDVIDRLSAAPPAVAAAVELYEAGKRRRKTVLAAAERRLSDTSNVNTDQEGHPNG